MSVEFALKNLGDKMDDNRIHFALATLYEFALMTEVRIQNNNEWCSRDDWELFRVHISDCEYAAYKRACKVFEIEPSKMKWG